MTTVTLRLTTAARERGNWVRLTPAEAARFESGEDLGVALDVLGYDLYESEIDERGVTWLRRLSV